MTTTFIFSPVGTLPLRLFDWNKVEMAMRRTSFGKPTNFP